MSKLNDTTLDTLRKKGGAICFDLVEQNLLDTPKSGADLHICTSYAQETAVKRLVASNQMGPGETFILLHNNDLKLNGFAPKPHADLKLVYVGLGQNLRLPPALADQIHL